MNAKEQLLQELDSTPEEVIVLVLGWVRSLKALLTGAKTSSTTQTLSPVSEPQPIVLEPETQAAHALKLLEQPVESESSPQQENAPTNGIQALLDLLDSMPLTAEEIATLPKDGAENHDHYLYGAPKKSP